MKVTAALLFLVACTPKPYFDERTCPFKVDATMDQGITMRCGTLHTPEVHGNPNVQIEVPVLVFLSGKAGATPIVNLSGGPGQSWANLGLDTVTATDVDRLTRDNIFIEQRGTGLSTPRLDCPDQAANQSDSDYVSACAAALQKQKMNLAAYNTAELSNDVATLVSLLGYPTVDLNGVSYGTSWAQQIMRDHAGILSGVLIDSVLSPVTPPLSGDASGADSAFSALFAACATDIACNTNYPNLEETMLGAIAVLQQNPLPVNGGGSLSAQDYFSTARTLLATSAPDAPNWIQEVSNAIKQGSLTVDNSTQTATQAESSATANDALGQYLSVLCSDNQFVTLQAAEADTAKARAAFQPFVDGSEIVSLCAQWPYQPRPRGAFALVTANVPTLVFSGDLDPLTPPVWAEQVAGALPSAMLVQVPGVGHDVSASAGTCVRSIAARFFTTPAVENTSCASSITASFAPPSASATARDGFALAHDLQHRLPRWRTPSVRRLLRLDERVSIH